MGDLNQTLSENQQKAEVENLNNRLETIYKQLCEYEESIDPNTLDDSNDNRIMELLETVSGIEEAAQMLRPVNQMFKIRQEDLETQIKLLDHAVDLLKLEAASTKSSIKK